MEAPGLKPYAQICFLVVLVFLLIAHEVVAKPYQHPATGLVFPDRLAGMDKGRITDYEKDRPGLGISIAYNSPGITMTIYLYTMGMKSVPNDPESLVFRKHFEQVSGDVILAGEKGLYSNVEKLSEEEVFLNPSQARLKALSASFSFVQGGRGRLSKLYLIGHKNHFLKVRFTYDKDAQFRAEETLKQLLKKLSMMIGGEQTGFLQPAMISADDFVRQYKIDYNSDKTLKNLVVSLQSLERALAILEQRYPAYIGKRQWSVLKGETFKPIDQDTPETGFAIGMAMYLITADMPKDKAQAKISEWDQLKKSSRSEYAQTMYLIFSGKHEEVIGELAKTLNK